MIKSKLLGYRMVGAGIALFIPDFPLFGFLTTNRIGFLVIFIGFLLIFRSNKSTLIFKRPSKRMRPFIWIVMVNFLSVFLSTLFHMTEAADAITSFLILINVLFLSIIVRDPNSVIHVLKTASLLLFCGVVILTLYSIFNYGFFAFNGVNFRYEINELGPGLSRISNGVIFANVYIIIWFFLTKSKISRNILLLSIIFSLWFLLATHSRQGLLFLIILSFGFVFSLYPTFRYKKVAFPLMVALLIFVFYKVFSTDSFNEFILDRSKSHLEEGSGSTADRLRYYRLGTEFFLENPVLGIGPGNFLNTVGRDAHGGYLRFISETGVLSFLGVVSLFFVSFVNAFRLKSLGFILITITILGVPFFNSIYDHPMIWSTLIIATGIFEVKGRSIVLR